MPLNQPAFPISFPLEDVSSSLESLLKEKGWRNFDQGDISLSYTPYYFFSYDFFTETEEPESKVKFVQETNSGFSSLNGSTGELNESLYSIIEGGEPQVIEKPE
ncbi:MAG: hypothetical protein V1847_00395, partial [Candidatus Diapherotrites archaeon]